LIHGCALHSHIFNSCIDKLQKRTIEKLDAYADGINEFVRLNNLPLEYSVLGINFEPWTIIDTLSIMKMTMFHMTYDWSIEVMSEYLFKFIQNKEVVHQLLPFHDKDTWVFNTTIMDDHEIEETIHQYFNNNFELKKTLR
jgi:acyl-homoserine lactone acylase PvdQ